MSTQNVLSEKSSKKFVHKRERRYFSEAFRKARVKELELNQTTVAEICRTYGVSSSSVYNWLKKYSLGYEKAIVKIVEPKSMTKKLQQKSDTIKELKQIIAEQQVKIVYYDKLLDILEQNYGDDLKKSIDLTRFSTLNQISKSLKPIK